MFRPIHESPNLDFERSFPPLISRRATPETPHKSETRAPKRRQVKRDEKSDKTLMRDLQYRHLQPVANKFATGGMCQ